MFIPIADSMIYVPEKEAKEIINKIISDIRTQTEEVTLESKKSLYSKEHEELCSKYSLLQDKNQKLSEEK